MPFSNHILNIPAYKRILSYLFPFTLYRTQSEYNACLEVILHQNRLQLATNEVLYSDGNKYLPAIEAMKAIRSQLPHIHKVLMLGGGMGSLVTILAEAGYYPEITLVEIDPVVLQLSEAILGRDKNINLKTICADVRQAIEQLTHQYDLIFIDVFESHIVPDFVTYPHFLSQCKALLNDKGIVLMNYFIATAPKWDSLLTTFEATFGKFTLINKGANKILWSRVG
ncbi:MAG: methyltransferase domain-containing protein [Chitinophagia bacterium]|nr:methyltransferase domain-containing protein [Chitinophagia bacterium]